MWTLRDDWSAPELTGVPASLASTLPSEPPASGRTPIRVTSVEDLGRLSEADLKKLEQGADGTAVELDTHSFSADLQRRLSAVSTQIDGLDFSVSIPPVANPAGTASTGGSSRRAKQAPGPEPPAITDTAQ